MQSNQRRRLSSFTWPRLRSINARLPKLVVREKPNVRIMQMLVQSYPDEQVVRDWEERLDQKRRAVVNHGGEQVQDYEQKDMGRWAPEGYEGSTKIGRAYSQSLLPRLPSVILHTIYKETHLEVDIKSTFTTMLTQLFGDVNSPTMDIYAQDPDRVYDRLRATLGMDRCTAKRVINAIICSYPNVAEDPDVGNWAEIGRDPLITAIKFEVSLWARQMKDQYPGFYTMVESKCFAERKLDHIDGTALFYAACDMEHSVMREVIQYLDVEGEDVVWKYDGLLVPKTKLVGKTMEQWVAELSACVKEKLLLDVDFAVKDLHANSFGICLGPDENNGLSPYERWKAPFERTFALCKRPPVFMMFSKDGRSFIDLKKCEFEHNTMEYDKALIKQWLDDADKRMYYARDFLPPPRHVPDGIYNMYHGISAADLAPNDREIDIDPYLHHVRLLMGSNDANAAYMHKLIAQKIQKPGLKWRVMPIVQSTQGVGKDNWFDFLVEIVGKDQCIKVDGVHKLVATNSGQLEGKLLCCFQEMGYKDTKEHEEYLKALITNATLQVEQKYVKTTHVTNVLDIIGFTNNFNAINVPQGDRRFFIVTADSTHAQDPDYHQPLLAWFYDDTNKRAVYDYYMQMDIEDFDSSAERPLTDAYQEAQEANISIIDRFLSEKLRDWKLRCREQDPDFRSRPNDTVRIKCAVAIAEFIEYAKEMHVKNWENRNAMRIYFGTKTSEMNGRTHKYVTQGHEKLMARISSSGKWYDIDVKGMEAYLAKTFDSMPEEEEQPETRRPRRTAHRIAGNRFEIRDDAEVVMVVDSLEEVNKELGEAYVDTRLEGDERVQVLVHQFRGVEIPLGKDYMGEMGRTRLEARYPYYVRDRTV
jgi:hypothetical protein